MATGGNRRSRLLVALQIVLLQQIVAKILTFLPQNGVNVVTVVLKTDVIIFDQKIGAVYDVVVRLVVLKASHPGEIHIFDTRLHDFAKKLMRFLMLEIVSVFLNKQRQNGLLVGGKLPGCQAIIIGDALLALGT